MQVLSCNSVHSQNFRVPKRFGRREVCFDGVSSVYSHRKPDSLDTLPSQPITVQRRANDDDQTKDLHEILCNDIPLIKRRILFASSLVYLWSNPPSSFDLKSMQAENSSNLVPPTSRSSNYIALKYCNFSPEITDHEVESYLEIVRRHASGLLPEMQKDDYAVKVKQLMMEDIKGGQIILFLKNQIWMGYASFEACLDKYPKYDTRRMRLFDSHRRQPTGWCSGFGTMPQEAEVPGIDPPPTEATHQDLPRLTQHVVDGMVEESQT
ncbi:hypothetical protein GIB67_023927 [Kingdonia uniflora]|uniref:Uncharacterized protein n=1 Tax=Kingdonia uniflora TaxID=39325 RepID=A0A7J7MVS7_9MAGN|nr:hypothetical protein GIB67_023927 [Kingdonia uniflora]